MSVGLVGFGPSTNPLRTKVLQWNSHPVPRAARAKVKRLLLPTNQLPRESNPGPDQDQQTRKNPLSHRLPKLGCLDTEKLWVFDAMINICCLPQMGLRSRVSSIGMVGWLVMD